MIYSCLEVTGRTSGITSGPCEVASCGAGPMGESEESGLSGHEIQLPPPRKSYLEG